MNAITSQSAQAMRVAEHAFQEEQIATDAQINRVTTAIRACPLNCAVIAQIFDTLAAQMKVNGFTDLDVAGIDDARGWICGE